MNIDLHYVAHHPAAIEPRYQTDGAGCFDLHTVEGGFVEPGGSTQVSTGLAFAVPEGWAMLIYSRSGHGFKHGVRLVNCVGVIDSDYRGVVQVKLANDGPDPFFFSDGDRVAQAMLVPVHRVALRRSDFLTATGRGSGGFGSTG